MAEYRDIWRILSGSCRWQRMNLDSRRARAGNKREKDRQTPKMTLPIAWNPDGFHIIRILAKGRRIESDYHWSNALTPICNTIVASRARACAKFLIRVDNARLHPAKCVQISWWWFAVSWPSYDLLTRSNIIGFLVVWRRQKSVRRQLSQIGEEFLDAISGILLTVNRAAIIADFREWLMRLKRYVRPGWEYVKETRFFHFDFLLITIGSWDITVSAGHSVHRNNRWMHRQATEERMICTKLKIDTMDQARHLPIVIYRVKFCIANI
jgi:hypothetical protein